MTTYNIDCPSCNRPSQFYSLFVDGTANDCVVVIAGESMRANTIFDRYGAFNQIHNDLVKCLGCGAIHHFTRKFQTSEYKLVGFFSIDLDELHNAVPETVRKDWAESKTALNAELSNASAIMTRRALQRICTDKNAQGRNLYIQINDLLTNSPDLLGLANEIREIGNLGAHPDNSIQNDLTLEEATRILDFLEFFIDNIYIIPHNVQEAIQNRLNR